MDLQLQPRLIEIQASRRNKIDKKGGGGELTSALPHQVRLLDCTLEWESLHEGGFFILDTRGMMKSIFSNM